MSEAADPADATFRQLLSREVLHSERQRVLSLAILLSAILAAILILLTVAPEIVEAVFHERVPYRVPLMTFLPFIAYELAAVAVFTRLARQGRRFPTFGRYGNAAIETSLPTVLIYLLTSYTDAPTAFSSWPTFLYFLFIILSTLRLDFTLSVFTGAIAAAELFGLAEVKLHLVWSGADFTTSISYHLIRSVLLLAGGILAGTVGATLKSQFERSLAAASARDRLTNLFGQHVSPQVVDRLLASGAEALSETRLVCVMFVDIRGFTAAARERSPAEVVARLDDAFAILVDIVDRHHGIVNKFLGDGFLAMFGAPIADPMAAANAVTAGREMLRAIDADNDGHAWPIRIGIGLHIGEAVTGNVGSPRRKEYTVIGDTVNLASRLESLNKELGSQFLISDAVHAAIGGSAEAGEPLGPVAIRGYIEPVAVWRLA